MTTLVHADAGRRAADDTARHAAPSAGRGSALASLLAQRWARDERRWEPKVRHLPDDRWYTQLFDAPDANGWLITWPPGAAIDLHDHGDSAASVVVVEGELSERYHDGPDAGVEARVLDAVSSVSFGPEHRHELRNEGEVPAVSIHVYSPPLRMMTFTGEHLESLDEASPSWSSVVPHSQDGTRR